MRNLLTLAFLAFSASGVACAPSDDDAEIGGAEANVDTSGCSQPFEQRSVQNHVAVGVRRPFRASCWNMSASGLSVGYVWRQTNDATPRYTNLGFWVSLNGADAYVKPDRGAYECRALPGGGFGHDTSGVVEYECSVTQGFMFGQHPDMFARAYEVDERPRHWDVRVAVSLDDVGTWDSLDGANYRFDF